MSKREKLNQVRVVNKQNLSKILKSNIHSQQAMEGIISQIKQEDQESRASITSKINNGLLDKIFDNQLKTLDDKAS